LTALRNKANLNLFKTIDANLKTSLKLLDLCYLLTTRRGRRHWSNV